MIMVQDDITAKFDGMPRSAIATGLVDYVLPTSKIPESLLDYIEHPFVRKSKSLDNVLSKDLDTLTKITLILRDHSGLDFSYYKENTIIRRLERRVSINRFNTLEQYLIFLSESNKEKETLYRELLIGVTRFFRDHEAFKALEQKVLPEILTKNKKALRVWITGCSTGEEVYSVAILIAEYIIKHNLDTDVKIFATDIDRHALDVAGQGYYSDSVIADVDPIYLTKYFTRRENGYQVNESLRKMVVFASHNLIKDPPFSKLDLLVCRNLFIYLKPDMQARILNTFYYSLNTNGILFMGSSESLGEMDEAFEPVDSKWKIYRYKSGFKSQIMREMPTQRRKYYDTDLQYHAWPSQKLQKMDKIYEAALTSYLPPSFIVDENDTILQVVNDVSQFTKIKPGRFTQNIFSILPDELSLFVNNLLRRLKKERETVVFENISGIKGSENQHITITGRPLPIEKGQYFIISFEVKAIGQEEKSPAKVSHFDIELQVNHRVTELEKELQMTRESLQATVEELETANEELQSSNEELIASNEELQSTNEELQSVNEELYTVNSEYQVKIEELTRLNNDLDNLLKNTEVGALYLDRTLCIRKITPIVSKITKILPTDIGRPISHIAVLDNYRQLEKDIQNVLESLHSMDIEITGDNGLPYLARIRPYRTQNNAMEGILVTFVDISKTRFARQEADEALRKLKISTKLGNLAWWEWDLRTNEVTYDDLKATMLGYKPEEFPTDVYKICDLIHPDDYEETMQHMRDYLQEKTEYYDIHYRIKKKDGSYGWFYDRGEITERDDNGKPVVLMGAVIDISMIKKMQFELNEQKELLQTILDNSPMAKTVVNEDGQITYVNARAMEVFGITQEDVQKRTYNDKLWEITGLDGKPIPPEKLPFSLIKKTGKRLMNYRHYIKIPETEPRLLSISGAPIKNYDGSFNGVVFSIGIVNE
jgi:two-component system, chemotaxis family, CheB/CheR fusion protein